MSVQSYACHLSTKSTPQTEPIHSKPMVPNSAGGFGFAVDDWVRLDRFLILGSSNGTYYVTEKKLTIENAECVLKCAATDHVRTVNKIVEISDAGRAPKNDPAIFALALIASKGSADAKRLALEAMPKVCRIGTHLFQFAAACNEMRGWGRGLRKAVANWYVSNKDASQTAFQAVKYQQRDGWSHRDLLRLSHANPSLDDSDDMKAVLHWIVKGWPEVGEKPHDRDSLKIVWAFERSKKATDKKEVCKLIRDYNLPRECVPTQFLTEAAVWEALLEKMPMTAMIRNLATMTRVGLLAPLSEAVKKVCGELGSVERLKKARVHPFSILLAQKIYASGRGEKSDKTWIPVQAVADALDESFYLAFDAAEPTGKRFMIGLDVSGSMGATICGSSLTCCEAATALSLVTTRVEPWTFTGRFNTGFESVSFGKKTRLDEALKYTRSINFGGTDCSLPMVYAAKNKIPVDTFLVITDNETYAGGVHPCQALVDYRNQTGIGAKLIVLAMTSSGFTIADPNDSGMIDIAGMDTAVPNLIADFAK